MAPNIFSAILWIISAGALAVAGLAWRQQPARGARLAALLSLSVALWCFGYGAELCVRTLDQMRFWTAVQYPGIATIPGFWLLLSLTYTRTVEVRRWRGLALIFAIPVLTVLAVWTNPWHRLYYVRESISVHKGVYLQNLTVGPLYWLFLVYAWSCVLLGGLAIIRTVPASNPHTARNTIILALAAAVPYGLALARALGWRPFGILDVSSFGLAAPTALLAYLITRRRLLSVRPLARTMVLDTLEHVLIVIDESGTIVDVNESAARLLGERLPAIGAPAHAVLSAWPEILEASQSRTPRTVEAEVTNAGVSRIYQVDIQPVSGSSYEPVGVALVWRDVTRQVQTERALRHRDAILQGQANAARALLTLGDPDESVHEALRILGSVTGSAEAFVYENQAEIVDGIWSVRRYLWRSGERIGDDAAPAGLSTEGSFDRWLRSLENEGAFPSTAVVLTAADRTELDRRSLGSAAAAPIRIGGIPWGFIGLIDSQDGRVWSEAEVAALTALAPAVGNRIAGHRALTELRASEQRFRSYFDLPLVGVVIASADRVILEVNDAFCEMLGYTRTELIGRFWDEITAPDGIDAERRAHDAVVEGAEPSPSFEKQYVHKSGRIVDVSIAARAVRTEDGAVDHVIGAVQDITEIKRDHERLRRLNETLEEQVAGRTLALSNANEELAAFADAVALELRSPMHTLAGFHRALVEEYGPSLEPEALHYVRRIGDEVAEALEMMDAALRLASVAHIELSLVSVDIADVVREIGHTLASRAPERSVELRVQDEMRVRTDPRLLRLILEELLGNAWKFTVSREHAVIEVGQDRSAHGPSFYVRDNGVGFDPVYRSRLFRIFHQLHDPAEYGGKGVGLAVVQRAVHQLGGDVWAEGSPGEGAAFSFTLPDPSD